MLEKQFNSHLIAFRLTTHKLKQHSNAHTRPPAKDRTESDCKDDGGFVYIGIVVALAPSRASLKPQNRTRGNLPLMPTNAASNTSIAGSVSRISEATSR